MIYLKFEGKKPNTGPISARSKVICTKDYTVADDEGGTRIYYEPGQWERVSEDDWLNCFVMSETGKTIDVIHPPER